MKKCKSSDLALKAYFLGPQAENAPFLESEVFEILRNYIQWRQNKFPLDGKAISPLDQKDRLFERNQNLLIKHLSELSTRFQNEIPQFSPRYMAHMFSELSLPGLLGHWMAVLHNPNNISHESSHVGIEIEAEAISLLCQMFGWPKGTGHFTSGGSLANLEALLRMREKLDSEDLSKNPVLILSASAHYSWKKALKIAGFNSPSCFEISLNSKGRMDVSILEKKLKSLKKSGTPILGLVSLFGSTELGSVDELNLIQDILEEHPQPIWHHTDAAYGGFFAAIRKKQSSHLAKQIKALRRIHSLTLDPHKLGYVPYGCGAFLCRKPEFYYYMDESIPYIQFRSSKDRGLQTIEGSRPATGSTATWLVAKTLGLHPKGLGLVLQRHLMAQRKLRLALQENFSSFIDIPGQDLNILCWNLMTKNRKLSDANALVQKLYQVLPQGPQPYYVAKTSLNFKTHAWLETYLQRRGLIIDADTCDLIRMTLMNPFSLTKESGTRFIADFVSSLKKVLR